MSTTGQCRVIYHLVNGRQYTSPAMSEEDARGILARWAEGWKTPADHRVGVVETETRVIRSSAVVELVLADDFGRPRWWGDV